MELGFTLVALGAIGSVVAPQALARSNKDECIPRRTNKGIVLFYVVYGVSVAIAIIGALLLPAGVVVSLIALALLLPLTLQLTARAHNVALQKRGDTR